MIMLPGVLSFPTCTRATKPAAPRGGEVDARDDGGEGVAVDLDPRLRFPEGRQLKTARLEPLREHAPARAVEPQRFREAAALVEEEVKVPVGGVETEPSHGAGQSIEAAPLMRCAA
jgi:hypothetical protein